MVTFAPMMMRVQGGGLDPDTTALLARMTVQPSAARITKIDTLIKAFKTAGVWTLLDCIQVYYAETEQQALLNWKGNIFNAAEVGTNTFVALSGMQTPGTTGNYIDTGFNPTGATNYTATAASYFYGQNRTANDTNAVIGYITNANLSLFTRTSTNLAYRINGSTQISVTNTAAAGFYGIDRASASTVSAYKNGAALGSGTANNLTIPNETMTIGRRTTTYQATDCYFFAAGAGLTATNHADIYNAITAYRT